MGGSASRGDLHRGGPAYRGDLNSGGCASRGSASRAVGMHPTGIHSCSEMNSI